MSDPMQDLQEQLAYLQQDMQAMSDELYAQQREIATLRLQIEHLKARLRESHSDSGILKPEEDSPPPHY